MNWRHGPNWQDGPIAYILNNRFCISELHRQGQVNVGRYERLVDRDIFDQCQNILHRRNPRAGNPEYPFAGGLITCAFCGQSMTGERIRRKLKSGDVRERVYYRCANNSPGPNHPTVRWKAHELEQAIVEDLARLRMPTPEIAAWFRAALEESLADLLSHQRRRAATLAKRKSELVVMQDRLLKAYLAGTVDDVFKAKTAELKPD